MSDDASPDDTEKIVAKYREKSPNLKYIRQAQNIGLDRNFLAVMDAATGDYIWLMGDDDRVEPGGAARVIKAIEHWPGIAGLTVGVVDYDPEMKRATGVRLTPPTQRMEGAANVFGAIADLLGFMSALVVNRKLWREVAHLDAVRRYENYYVQVYIIGRIIDQGGSWGVLSEPCVGFRTGNDQFLAKFGWLERLKIDVVAYDQIANGLFGNDRAAKRKMQSRILSSHVFARLLNTKTSPGRTPHVMRAAAFLFWRYKGLRGYWTRVLPTLLLPKWSLRTARSLYQRFARSSGAARARTIATH